MKGARVPKPASGHHAVMAALVITSLAAAGQLPLRPSEWRGKFDAAMAIIADETSTDDQLQTAYVVVGRNVADLCDSSRRRAAAGDKRATALLQSIGRLSAKGD